VIAQYAAEQAYSTARQEIQDKIHRLVEDRLTEKMMEREGEESYRASMRDTIILYDILVTGIELPTAIIAAINRKTEQYCIAEEYKFRSSIRPRACSGMRWNTSRILNRLPPLFGARPESTNVLSGLPDVSGGLARRANPFDVGRLLFSGSRRCICHAQYSSNAKVKTVTA
jgi:hypothetical protein